MERKHTGKIIALFALLFIVSFGEIVEQLARTDMDYDTSTGYGLLITLANMCLTSTIMMAVPTFAKLVNKEKLPYKSGKRLCLWNSIILFILSSILLALTEVNFIGGIGAVIFYFINKWIFVAEEITVKAPIEQQSTPIVEHPTHICLSEEGQKQKEYGHWNVYGSDITLDKSEAAATSYQVSKPHPSVPVATPPKASVPSKKAISAGVYTIITILSIALFAACVVCIVLFSSISKLQQNVADLQEEVAELEKENEQYFEYYEDSFHKIDFLDSRIVFIENDGSTWYHRYECSRFVGNDWWAHNTEYAEYIGYDPCPYCFD